MTSLLNRSQLNLSNVNSVVEQIIAEVKQNKDAALQAYTKLFDGVSLQEFRVTEDVIQAAWRRIDPNVLKALTAAKQNIEDYHRRQRIEPFSMLKPDGSVIEQRVFPIPSVGIYVPGGTAAYPSTVLMNAIPAKIAGVPKIVMITPPSSVGLKDSVLVAASMAGVDEIYTVGGAQGIAALAFGTEQIPRVDKIVGPGNVYVAVAKRMVAGYVGTDMVAGPSEIAILADDRANPEWIAADLMSQAEHDPYAAAILVTDSARLAALVQNAIDRQIKTLSRKNIIAASLKAFGAIVLVDSLIEGIRWINEIAPEHLEIVTEDPSSIVPAIRHAGSVFLGPYTPEPVGDYFAGPNHTLPTSGTARFQSALSTTDFQKKMSVVSYSKEALLRDQYDIVTLAIEEGLDAHANAIRVRFGDKP
jgi:histidinol dehydrogenase